MDYIVRENNTQKVFLSENSLNVEDILKRHYPYIYASIESEGFILKYDTCNLFKELICDRKVVGFCSYDHSREFLTAALNNIYILPEFRGNGIFKRELERTMVEYSKPSIMEPTRLVVEILIKYGFAKRFTESIVASAIEFIVPGKHVLSNEDYGNEELSTHFYDLSICSSIHVLNARRGHVAYSAPLNYDIIHYACLDNIDSIGEEYFNQIVGLFSESGVELMDILIELEGNLPVRKYALEEVIGEGDDFSPYILSLIDDNHVTYTRALEISRQIREEYEAGMVLGESLLIRLAYLFDDDDGMAITSHEDVCPYCGMPVDDHDRFCHYCGINLEFSADEMERHLVSSVNASDGDFKEDIRYVAYKFLKMIDEGIDLQYAAWTVENAYGIDFEELNSFLDDHDCLSYGAITWNGRDFMNSHPLHFWEKYHMDAVDYTDFERYFYSKEGLDPIEICFNYLNLFVDDECALEIIREISRDY
jgi:GNAT superfamily N-acetyltransferase